MGVAPRAMLAQAGQNGGDTGQLLIWVGALIVAVVIGTIVLLMVRRHMMRQSGEGATAFGTMEDMRAMVDRGEMSKEEYEQVRKAMIAKIKQSQNSPNGENGKASGNGARDGTGSTSAR